jgi:TonB family protein
MTARAASTENYLELADFQYAGDPAGGSGAPAPKAAAKAASPAPAEIVDPNQPTDPSQAAERTASNAGASAEGSDFGGGSGNGSGGGEGDGTGIDYVPFQKVTQMPVLSEKSVLERIPYPEMAHRAGIMGKVFLELFVDAKGKIRKIVVLKEDPAGYGFADAAVSAFNGATCVPAKIDGKPVAVRFRYPVRFSLN